MLGHRWWCAIQHGRGEARLSGTRPPWELQRGFLTFFPLSSLSSPFFSFYLSLFLFLTNFLLLSLFFLSFPLTFPLFPYFYFLSFPHCHGPTSLFLVPAGLFEHSLSAFAVNPFPKSFPSIA